MDRDLVHRQTACAVVMHMSLGVAGLGCEQALLHLLNYVFPNIFEQAPHIIQVCAWAALPARPCVLAAAGGWHHRVKLVLVPVPRPAALPPRPTPCCAVVHGRD